jgi:hypothetical protein
VHLHPLDPLQSKHPIHSIPARICSHRVLLQPLQACSGAIRARLQPLLPNKHLVQDLLGLIQSQPRTHPIPTGTRLALLPPLSLPCPTARTRTVFHLPDPLELAPCHMQNPGRTVCNPCPPPSSSLGVIHLSYPPHQDQTSSPSLLPLLCIINHTRHPIIHTRYRVSKRESKTPNWVRVWVCR